jgi:folate-binding protein YgfZ
MTPLAERDRAAVRALAVAGVWHALPEARLLEARGPDAARYLHAMSTQDLAALPPGRLAYAALADDRGRYLADFWVWRPGGAWVLEVSAALADALARRLALFAVSDEVEVAVDATRALFHLEGPRAPEVARRLAGAAPEAGSEVVAGVAPLPAAGAWCARRSRYGEAGVTLAVPAERAAEVGATLAEAAGQAGLAEAGAEAREALRLEAGRPLGGTDLTPEDLIPEAGLAAAVALAKGCFPGQEILQRVARRGGIRRRLGGIVLDPAVAGTELAGAAVESEAGRRLGAVTSAAEAPRLGAVAALAWLGPEAWPDGTALRVRASRGLFAGRSSGLPFVHGAEGPVSEVPRYPERTPSAR